MIDRLNTTAGLALDTQSLEQLRSQAKHSPDQALKAAAQQFESVFLNMMLKSMREATMQDGIFDSEQTKMFTGMLDQQLAQNMSSRGVGLADIMVKQLSRNSGAIPVTDLSVPAPSAVDQRTAQLISAAATMPLGGDTVPVGAETAVPSALPSAYSGSTQQDFVNRMSPYAIQASRSSGVPAQLMLGQAALESGWGKQEIRNSDGSSSYNLFGIKATSGWKGRTADVMTTEYKDGVAHKQVEKFRAYSSYAEAFQDYANLMSGNPRYAGVLQQGGNLAGMAQAVQKAGYATDPKYADKLTRVMNQMAFKG
ncbi:MAG: flagellar assembly peptidoglycan hydrolase FlgJ [Gallionella sp.]|nr:flagellar assembly peptidoglycan hydrolase FlgJ [Gallionella sp.]